MTLLRDRGSWQPSSRRLTVVQSAWAETDLGMLRAADIAERDGWDLSLVEVETGQQGGWSALAHQLSAAEPAAVMIGNYFVEDAVAFLDSFLQNPGDTLLYTLYSPSVPEFRRLMGERADGLLWATVSGTYSDSYARAFADRYRDRFGVSPGRSHAGIAYDRVGLIAHAWKYAENPRDSLTVAKELRQVIYRGVNGVYCLGDRSQTTLTYPDGTTDPSLAQAHLVFQIQGGHQRIIDPAPYADGEFVLPSWMRRRVLR
jgi:branched-chain amino acid transport system substrate-binding protein